MFWAPLNQLNFKFKLTQNLYRHSKPFNVIHLFVQFPYLSLLCPFSNGLPATPYLANDISCLCFCILPQCFCLLHFMTALSLLIASQQLNKKTIKTYLLSKLPTLQMVKRKQLIDTFCQCIFYKKNIYPMNELLAFEKKTYQKIWNFIGKLNYFHILYFIIICYFYNLRLIIKLIIL